MAAFRRHHFKAALAEFEKAEAAEPQSAAAAFYLGYTYYKIGEPSRRMNANKEKARELFAKAFSLDPAFGRAGPSGAALSGRRRAVYCSSRWTKLILLMSE